MADLPYLTKLTQLPSLNSLSSLWLDWSRRKQEERHEHTQTWEQSWKLGSGAPLEGTEGRLLIQDSSPLLVPVQAPCPHPYFSVAGKDLGTLCLIMLYYVIILFYLITYYSNILHTHTAA